MNPLTALAVAVLLVCVAYVVPAPTGPLVALALALAIAAMTGAGSRVALLTASVGIPTWLFIAVMNAVVSPQRATIPILGVSVAPAALAPAAWIAARLGAAVAALGWMIVTTPTQRLVRALAQRGLRAWSQYLLAASVAAVPEARRRAHEVLDAQRCRGLTIGGGPLARLRTSLSLAGPLMVSLITDAERHAMALDARAFDTAGRRTSLTEIADSNAERALRAVMWGATVALLVWAIVRRIAAAVAVQ